MKPNSSLNVPTRVVLNDSTAPLVPVTVHPRLSGDWPDLNVATAAPLMAKEKACAPDPDAVPACQRYVMRSSAAPAGTGSPSHATLILPVVARLSRDLVWPGYAHG